MSPWYAEKIGPLPVGAWAGVVAAGLGIGYYERRHKPAVTTDPTQAPTMAVPPDATVGGGAGGGGSSGGDAGSQPPPAGGGVQISIQTNDQWGSEATRQLIARGTPPLLADLAVRNYLQGANLTAQQEAIVNTALQILGPPPVPPPLPLPNIPPPEPPAPQPAPGDPYPPPSTPAQPPDNTPIAPQPPPPPVQAPPAPEPPTAAPGPVPGPSGPPSCASISPGPASFGYLENGSRGTLVAQAQDALRAHGHDPGPSDGIFGPHTEAAVRAEQADCGVQIDGIIGRQTACCLGMS